MIIFNALQTSLNGGIGRYSYELAKELYNINKDNIKIVIREQDLKLFSYINQDDLIIASNINNSRDRNIYEQFKLPKIIKKRYPDAIIHYPDTMAPILASNPVVITVHDLAFKSVEGAFTWKQSLWKNIITDLSVRKAKKIIAITNFTKTEIEKHYPKVSRDKISVVYNGFNNFSKDKIDKSKVRKEISELKKPYILTVSTISPRKNVDGLIKAFNNISDKIEEDLIIAGGNGWMYEDVYNLVDKLNLKDRVKFTGRINDEELKLLYSNARVFVFPSYYEGFGLPPIEAMAFDIPIASSNMSCMPEVLGNEVEYFDPYNADDIGKAITKCLNNVNKNKEIKYNNVLKRFAWNKCGEEVSKIYNCIKIKN